MWYPFVPKTSNCPYQYRYPTQFFFTLRSNVFSKCSFNFFEQCMFTASGRRNLYEGKGFNKAGVCNWLPLYYRAGMYRVPLCYIAVNCDKERLGYLRNLGSLSRNQIYQSWRVQ